MKRGKLDQLASVWGMAVDALLRKYATDSLSPAICMNEECDFANELEPDCRAGWCEECRENSMKSAFVLAGLI